MEVEEREFFVFWEFRVTYSWVDIADKYVVRAGGTARARSYRVHTLGSKDSFRRDTWYGRTVWSRTPVLLVVMHVVYLLEN